MTQRTHRLFMPALLAGALGLSACGDGNGNGNPNAPEDPQGGVVTVTGRITSNTTWRPPDTYLLRGAVFVDPGVTLTIEPGTRIVGEQSSTGALVVTRGGRLVANGTETQPIVFTSDRPQGQRARGDWGGLILNGAAPVNIPGGEGEGEGGTGLYGGSNPNDSSGSLRYVRVEFAGIEFSPDNELNGIAFQGVGGGTTCENLQVHFNKDDGFEWFGGTVSCKRLVATAIGDDLFDWTEGWQGRGQFWVGQQRGDDADNGFESDNNAENNNLEPRSSPFISNVTLIGAPGTQDGSESDLGMLLREGTAGRIFNFIVLGFKEFGVAVDHEATLAQARSGALMLQSGIVAGNLEGPFDGDAAAVAGMWANVSTTDPQLAGAYNVAAPNFQPAAAGPARDGSVPVTGLPDDGFFEPVDFIGAIGQVDWTRGWTTSAPN